jgi:hypothetical protein
MDKTTKKAMFRNVIYVYTLANVQCVLFNILAPEFYTEILAHPVWKMWITQEQKKVELWKKRHFEEKNEEYAACLKYSVLIFVKKIYIKCNIWRVKVRPSYM